MKKPAIKLKARGFFLADGRMLVTPSFDSVKEKPQFRLPGGQIEFGERSEVALAREMREEFAADVEVLELLDVVQNVFYYGAGSDTKLSSSIAAASLTKPFFAGASCRISNRAVTKSPNGSPSPTC